MALRIDELVVTGGYLERSPVRFPDGLTCIIGARGTCKSTLLETIRFAFDADKARIELMLAPNAAPNADLAPAHGLIRSTLQSATAKCTTTITDNAGAYKVVIERSIDSAPRMFQDGVRQLDRPDILSQLEIYSQGDLQEIASQSSKRLQLIDKPNQAQVEAMKAKREALAARLRELGQAIRRGRIEIESRRDKLRALEDTQKQFAALQGEKPTIPSELTEEQQKSFARTDFANRVEAALRLRAEAVAALEQAITNREVFVRASNACRDVPAAAAFSTDFADLGALLEDIAKRLPHLQEQQPLDWLQSLRLDFERQSERYYTLRKQQTAANDALRREDTLRQEILKLQVVDAEVKTLRAEMDKAASDRRAIRAEFERIGDALYELRTGEIERINSEFSAIVALTLRQGLQSESYTRLIMSLLEGSRIRNQDDVAADIAKTLRPAELIEIVETSDPARLATLLNRDVSQMVRIVSHLADHQRLYEIESVVFDDWLEITLFVDSEYRPVHQLSKGQMATALLPLILRDAPYPLIFDQPEDDLDNAFIYKSLVQKIRSLKKTRQLIFVTHNANIPVLGDADQVVVMSMEAPSKAGKALVGSLDDRKEDILTLLEGGAEAFKLRRAQYGKILMED